MIVSLGKWVVRLFYAVLALFMVLAAAVYWVLATEEGAQWVLSLVEDDLPVEIDPDSVRGTLAGTLEAASVRFISDNVDVEIDNARVNLDWSASNMSTLVFDELGAAAVRITTRPSEEESEEGLDLEMAPLPIELSAGSVSVGLLRVNTVEVSKLKTQGLLASGIEFSATSVAGFLEPPGMQLGVTDARVEVSGALPLSGVVSWQMVLPDVSGTATVSGDLDDYFAEFDARYGMDADSEIRAVGTTHGNLERIWDTNVRAETPAGNLVAAGSLGWSDGLDIMADSIAGTYQGNEVIGDGRLQYLSGRWICTDCDIAVGENQVDIDGSLVGDAIQAEIAIDAPSLSDFSPKIAGTLKANGRLGGTIALPILSGSAEASGLSVGSWKLEQASLQTQASTTDVVDVVANVTGLQNGEQLIGNMSVAAQGGFSDLNVNFNWSSGDYGAEIDARATIEGQTVSGTIERAVLIEPRFESWRAANEFAFNVSPPNVSVGEVRWESDALAFETLPTSFVDEVLNGGARLPQTPLSVFSFLAPDLRWPDGSINAELRITDNQASLSANLDAEEGLTASANASVPELSLDAPLTANLHADLAEVYWLTTFVPEVDELEGAVVADMVFAGTVANPIATGEIRWDDGSFVLPMLNLAIDPASLVINGNPAGGLRVAGNAVSGDGDIAVTGNIQGVLAGNPVVNLELKGRDADVLNWPDYFLNASHDLEVVATRDNVTVTGRVDMNRADIQVREIPEGAVSPSDDVVVEGREREERSRLGIDGDVVVALSDDIHVRAFGLDTHVSGELRLNVTDGREPTARGELELNEGSFQMYGQRLEIERGTMIFSGPLDNPVVNVRAVRKIEEVGENITVGINLTGEAQNITSTLFSEPAMSEAETLSYLMFGRPLNVSTAADGTLLTDAAFGLGLRSAGLITNQIGQAVGLDEFEVTGNNQNTTELVAGKQINSRLYARYAYGVFSRLGHLLIRYRLSESLSIELGVGEHQSMDILYTIERE